MKTLILLFSVLFTTMSFTQVPSYVPNSGLVGWWPFNGNANDESGNGNNGTVNGATLTTDRNGLTNSSFNFNVNNWSPGGSGGDKIYIPYNPSFNFSDFTISTWVKRTSSAGGIINRFQYGYNNPNGETWILEFSNNILYGTVIEQSPSPAQSFHSQSNQTELLNQWCNIIMTYSQNTINLFINNQLVGTSSDPSITINTVGNSGITIGLSEQANGQWQPFDGSIDDIGIWNRALTDCEIQNLYTTSPAQPTGLSCYQTAAFNTATCSWDVTGTQPVHPTLACYETATFNTTLCQWGVSGSQEEQPTLACYETATFNTTSCSWVVITGTQPTQPTLACYETATFNTISCVWDLIGDQPTQPTGLACYETANFNTTTCAWNVTGTQPTQPTGLECYQTLGSFNSTSCSWDVTGTQPAQPTLACYETAVFNTTTCSWVISGPQAPQKMSYQAVIRNSNDSLLISTPVGMRISLVQGAPSGTVVFSETQTATTNANGLVSLQIGMGTAVTGAFACIDWAAGPYYVKTETDLSGGTNYTIISSNEILSVPYALFSANGTPGPQGPQGLQGPQGIAGNNGNDGTFPPGTAVGEMNYWNGTAWVAVAPGTNNQNLTFCNGVPTWGPCPIVIGQSYQGGIVAYILQPGDPGYVANVPHGLIAAPSDLGGYAQWGCYGTGISGADGTAIGTGNQNTIDIMTGCSQVGIAARLCGDLVLGGYSDWYLPSKDELNKLYINRVAIGGFTDYYYWSSTEFDFTSAWLQYFFNGGQYGNFKTFYSHGVRAVRAF